MLASQIAGLNPWVFVLVLLAIICCALFIIGRR